MTLQELYTAIKVIGYPVAYSHFVVTEQNPHPNPPYITYQFAYSSDLQADNQNYIGISNFQVELYTAEKDLAAEKKVEDKLKELGLPFSKVEAWLEDEKVFQIIYEVQLIGG